MYSLRDWNPGNLYTYQAFAQVSFNYRSTANVIIPARGGWYRITVCGVIRAESLHSAICLEAVKFVYLATDRLLPVETRPG